MRRTNVTYVCDRCGSDRVFDGEKMGRELMTQSLDRSGWLIVTLGLIAGTGTDWSRHLCKSCVSDLNSYIGSSSTELVKPDTSTVE